MVCVPLVVLFQITFPAAIFFCEKWSSLQCVHHKHQQDCVKMNLLFSFLLLQVRLEIRVLTSAYWSAQQLLQKYWQPHANSASTSKLARVRTCLQNTVRKKNKLDVHDDNLKSSNTRSQKIYFLKESIDRIEVGMSYGSFCAWTSTYMYDKNSLIIRLK